ncbi:MAG: rhodanese-like domain-containing protein [Patescibacteria group bacterium]
MIGSVNPVKLEEIIEKEKDAWEIIDVRERFEWDEGHIQGAKLIPMGEIVEREREIDWSKKVIFYCRSGNRSRHVADYFSQNGKDVWNLEGGVL